MGIQIGHKKKLQISFEDVCFLGFVFGLFSFTLYGFILALIIGISSLLYCRRIQVKEDAERLRKIKILKAEKEELRIKRRSEEEENRIKKRGHRLPKSSIKYFIKLKENNLIER